MLTIINPALSRRIPVLNNVHQLPCAQLARRAAARAGAQATAQASIDADHVTQVLVLIVADLHRFGNMPVARVPAPYLCTHHPKASSPPVSSSSLLEGPAAEQTWHAGPWSWKSFGVDSAWRRAINIPRRFARVFRLESISRGSRDALI